MNLPVLCITGGANGLGFKLALSLSKSYQVIIFDIDKKNLKKAAKEINCDYQICDVSDYKSISNSIEKVFKKYQKIDCFINNAGLYIDGPLESNDPQRIKKVFEVNSIAPVFASKILIPFFKKQNFGTIININSTAGLHPRANNSVYHSSKWALTGFTKSLQEELSSLGIKVIDINSGVLSTNFTQGTDDYDPENSLDPDQVVKAINFVLSLDKNVTIPQLTIKRL